MREPTPESEDFKIFYMKYVADISGYALRRASAADAADVVSETFLVAWRRYDEIPMESALPWLYGVARRVLANSRRGNRRRAGLSQRLRNHFKISAPANSGEYFSGVIGQAISELSESDREVLLLTAWEGMKPAGISEVLQISSEAARTRVSRARQNLRQELAKLDFE